MRGIAFAAVETDSSSGRGAEGRILTMDHQLLAV